MDSNWLYITNLFVQLKQEEKPVLVMKIWQPLSGGQISMNLSKHDKYSHVSTVFSMSKKIDSGAF